MKDITKAVHDCVPECSSCGKPIAKKVFYKNGRLYCGSCAADRGFKK